MNPSNHAAVKVASAAGGIAAVAALCVAADLTARHLGVIAGAALICAVFAACWIVRQARPMLHPVPLAHRSGIREAGVTTETVTLAGTVASR